MTFLPDGNRRSHLQWLSREASRLSPRTGQNTDSVAAKRACGHRCDRDNGKLPGFAGFFPGMQELRIISPATGPYCLLAATGVYYLFAVAKRKLSGFALNVSVIVGLVLGVTSLAGEYRTFRSAVVATGMPDLPVLWLRQAIAR